VLVVVGLIGIVEKQSKEDIVKTAEVRAKESILRLAAANLLVGRRCWAFLLPKVRSYKSQKRKRASSSGSPRPTKFHAGCSFGLPRKRTSKVPERILKLGTI
jgi:hypothetical protein